MSQCDRIRKRRVYGKRGGKWLVTKNGRKVTGAARKKLLSRMRGRRKLNLCRKF